MNFEAARLIQLQALDNEMRKTGESPQDNLKRDKIVSAMPPQIVSRYERLRGRYPQAVARLVGGVCEGCRVRMANSLAQRLRAQGTMQICDHCGRFIYFDGD